MYSLRFVVLFGVLALGIFALCGCAQQGASANQSQGSNRSIAGGQQNATAPAGPSGQAGLISDWKEYNQTTFSFEYPAALSVQESLGSYGNGSGYGVLALQDSNVEDPAMLFYYIRLGNLSAFSQKGAGEIAKSMLESDNSNQDMMGVLDSATDKGGISVYATKNGYGAADMTFKYYNEKSSTVLNGYAVQVFDPATTVGIKARILAVDAEKAKETRDHFVDSLKVWKAT